MLNRAAAVHAVWVANAVPSALRHATSMARAGSTQRTLLHRRAVAAANSVFGRAHGLDRCHTAEDVRTALPARTWEDLSPWLERIRAGEPQVLSDESVQRLVPTGGSSGGCKLVPWTPGLAADFRAMLASWIVDLARRHPAALAGSAYWSVTPSGPTAPPSAAVPVGFADDTEYVGGRLGPLIAAALAAPSCLGRIGDLEAFRHATLRCLLGRADLSLISVWHPSFLGLLLDELPRRRERLIADIADGGCSANLPAAVRAAAAPWLAADPARARALAAADWGEVRALWPRLALVSCWGDGPAAAACTALTARLGGVAVQVKGLLATEAPISVPWGGTPVLAAGGTVVEFIGDDGLPRWCDEVETGADYDLLLTTGGGLWRYRIGDRVRVVGRCGAAPRLRFLGRSDGGCDLVGEKLTEAFVADLLTALAPEASTLLLAPRADRAGYLLFCDRPIDAEAADLALAKNPQYALARRLGQLGSVSVRMVGPDSAQRILAVRAAGRQFGAVKPAVLDSADHWEALLCTPV